MRSLEHGVAGAVIDIGTGRNADTTHLGSQGIRAIVTVLIHPQEHSVVATLNLNGDYCSDALAAQVGGIGIAPGANINYRTGHAVFEATHGTAPKLAGLDKVNPCSFLLSAEMMLRYMGWVEAADRIVAAIEGTIADKTVTADLAEMIPGSTAVSTTAFADALLAHIR